MVRKAALLAVLLLALCAGRAAASPYVQFGVQDDAWILTGPGTLDSRLDMLAKLGPDVVRVTLRWDQVAPTRPAHPVDPTDPAYRWTAYDALFAGLRSRGIGAVVTLWGTPAWANGGAAPNRFPVSSSSLASFAAAAAHRYPWIHRWTVWNEPNLPLFARPVSPRIYTTRLLNPTYAALKAASRANIVAGGVTSPRQGSGISPVAFLRGMAAAHARLDVYAENPYPLRPHESPTSGGCMRCAEYTMATLPKLVADVGRYFGPRTRIWLTEWGYNSKPPSTWLGVSNALQARYMAEGARRAYAMPKVDLLIHFLVRDEPDASRWTSGLFTAQGVAKPSLRAFSFPLVELSRRGSRAVVWGQVRPRTGPQPYRLERFLHGRWTWLGGTYRTSPRGYFTRTVAAPRGAKLRLWSPLDHAYSPLLPIR